MGRTNFGSVCPKSIRVIADADGVITSDGGDDALNRWVLQDFHQVRCTSLGIAASQ